MAPAAGSPSMRPISLLNTHRRPRRMRPSSRGLRMIRGSFVDDVIAAPAAMATSSPIDAPHDVPTDPAPRAAPRAAHHRIGREVGKTQAGRGKGRFQSRWVVIFAEARSLDATDRTASALSLIHI